MYAKFMIVGLAVIAIGWAVYFIWDYKMRQKEKSQPKIRSERFQKTSSEISDWAKKMADFKKPTYKRPEQDDSTPQPPNS